MANPNRDHTGDDDALEIATGDVDLHELVTQYMQETVIARQGGAQTQQQQQRPGTLQATSPRFASKPSSPAASSQPERTEIISARARDDSEGPRSGLDETQPLEPIRLDESNSENATNDDDGTALRPGGGAFDEATTPGLLPIPKTGAVAANEKRGDVRQLLASIGPFLWSLEGAERWVRAHGAGDAEAESYARALGLLARVLSQLQARVDEVEGNLRRD